MRSWAPAASSASVSPRFPRSRQGLLTGKYRKGQPLPAGSRATWQSDHQINDLLTDENLDKVEQLRKVADELGTNCQCFPWRGSCSTRRSAV